MCEESARDTPVTIHDTVNPGNVTDDDLKLPEAENVSPTTWVINVLSHHTDARYQSARRNRNLPSGFSLEIYGHSSNVF